jgi:hypothetical protein
MQTDSAKRGFGRSFLWWIIGTTAAVPVTKMVESYYDVSFLTPAILIVWEWVNQELVVVRWLVLALLVVLLALAGLGFGVIRDTSKENEQVLTELRKASLKIKGLLDEVKTLTFDRDQAQAELSEVCSRLNETVSALSDANRTISSLQKPIEKPLNEQQRRVLAFITHSDNSGEQCTVGILGKRLQLTLVQADNARDVLLSRGLVEEYSSFGITMISLSPKGRAHVLEPDFNMSFL